MSNIVPKVGAPLDMPNDGARARVPQDGNPNRDVQNALLQQIAAGYRVVATCQLVGIDKDVLYRWRDTDKDFATAYREAQLAAADVHAERPEEIVEEIKTHGRAVSHEQIGVAKLGIDVHKWRAKTLNPAVYGDKIQAEHSGKGGGPIDVAIQVEFVSTK